MRGTLISTALVATAAAQGVTSIIPPPGAAPAQCQASANGRWELSVEPLAPESSSIPPIAPVSAVPVAPMPGMPAEPIVPLSASSGSSASSALSASSSIVAEALPMEPAEPPLEKRADPVTNTLLVTLDNGVLKDRYNRIGYIAANRQFQFDAPPQAGSLYTGGWSLCNNGTLALGPSAVFYRCQSGGFYNLYDEKWAPHCQGIFIHATKARDEVVSEVPPLPSTAPAAGPPGAAPGTTPAVIVPPAMTTITDSSSLSKASSLSSVASSAASVASSASSSASKVAAGAVSPSPVGPPGGAPPANDADSTHISTAAVLSMAFIFAALLL